MTDWIRRYESGWNGEWFGACPANTFGYSFPIMFSWSAQCGEGSGGRFPGYGDGGVATLVLDLENGYTVKHSWFTDIIKARSGIEKRTSRNDVAREAYAGDAILLDEQPRRIRALLSRHAATAPVFLLGLPHEELPLVTDSVGATVFVPDTSLSDWAQIGQRVVVAHVDDDDETLSVDAVIQDVGADWIELDVAPGALGKIGGAIMPVKPVYLAPQQNFPRFAVEAEVWQLDAQCAVPMDFAPVLASLALGPVTSSSAFDDASVTARVFGLQGDALSFELEDNGGAPTTGEVVETGDGYTLFRYQAGVTTLGNLRDALAAATWLFLTGDYDPDDTIESGDDFGGGGQPLTGAGDSGTVGSGATLTDPGFCDDRPVWDRPLDVPAESIVDGLQAMTQTVDHGGVPYGLGMADEADWFRAVIIEDGDDEAWQWFKLFMSRVNSRQKTFWLPTWREDLIYVEHAGNELVIEGDGGDALGTLGSGGDDLTSWWPKVRNHIQIEQEDGTITYTAILDAARDGDDWELEILHTLSDSPVTRISWLELCRFENGDEYTTRHDQRGFSVSLVARALPDGDA